jgi:hypothetical protein
MGQLSMGLQAFDLAQLALQQGAEVRQIGRKLSLQQLVAFPHLPLLVLGLPQEPEGIGSRLSHDAFRLPLGLLLGRDP